MDLSAPSSSKCLAVQEIEQYINVGDHYLRICGKCSKTLILIKSILDQYFASEDFEAGECALTDFETSIIVNKNNVKIFGKCLNIVTLAILKLKSIFTTLENTPNENPDKKDEHRIIGTNKFTSTALDLVLEKFFDVKDENMKNEYSFGKTIFCKKPPSD